jgi:hypothetical protein
MDADFEPAMLLADGLDALDLAFKRCFEIAFDLRVERRLVVLHDQKIVGFGIEDGLDDGRIVSHGVDRHQGALDIEAFQKGRSGGGLDRLLIDRL